MNSVSSCNKCVFFDEESSKTQAMNAGLCRFNPPVSQPGPDAHGLWPVVSTQDWCGHFTADRHAGMAQAAE